MTPDPSTGATPGTPPSPPPPESGSVSVPETSLAPPPETSSGAPPETSSGAPPESDSAAPRERYVLDSAHVGDIQGAFGTIGQHEAGRRGLRLRTLALLAIIGPGLIVMVGDNDAGGVATYSQAGQNYGTSLLWVMLLLIPVLIVNQEMVVRLGAVTGVGHARLIIEQFGKFWGAFSGRPGDLWGRQTRPRSC